MLAFLIQRVLQAIFVMFVVALISFSLFHYVGDPVLNMLGQEATEADREHEARSLTKAGPQRRFTGDGEFARQT